VPRPGVAAVDPATGVPLAWNPGRHPRGDGTYALLATATGLWMGSDTNYVGRPAVRAQKIAFFPLAGGQPVASKTSPALPAQVVVGPTPPTSPVLYRVNAGGAALAATDGGPQWIADNTSTSARRNSGSTAKAYSTAVGKVDTTVPASTPKAVFTTERFDTGARGDALTSEMRWNFPVPTGTAVEVRLYFANRCACTRVFDVAVEATRINDLNVAAASGAQTGTMRSVKVTSDGTVNVDLLHESGNTFVNAIEVVRSDTGTAASGFTARTFDGTNAGAATPTSTPLQADELRGITTIGNTVFYGKADGNLYERSLDGGGQFGPEALVDPYNDPTWSDILNGSGGVDGMPEGQTYRGVRPNFYGEISNVTSMFYDAATSRLYYTLSGSAGLFYRVFSPDIHRSATPGQVTTGGVVHPVRNQVANLQMPAVTGAFLAGGNLYFVKNADGSLYKQPFTSGRPSGTAVKVGGNVDWRSKALFLAARPAANTLPTASMETSCGGLHCVVDGRSSFDSDGSITRYEVSWGDGSVTAGAGSAQEHDYAAAGTYTVTLTVTDDAGGQGTTTRTVVVEKPAAVAPTASFTSLCDADSCAFDASGSSDPDATLTSYAWDFGDGSSGTGQTVDHPYSAPGTYAATLTVTDAQGLTDTETRQVSTSPIGFRAAGTPSASTSATPTATVPAEVQPGDALLLVLSHAQALTVKTPPAGWTPVLDQPNGAFLISRVWQRVAVDGDAGRPVAVGMSGAARSVAQVLAYSGTDQSVPVSSAAGRAETAASTTHPAPGATTATQGSWVVSYWSDKVTTEVDTGLAVPAGLAQRSRFRPLQAAYISTLVADQGGAAQAGAVAGPTATTTSASRANAVTLVLAPVAQTGSTAPPPQPASAQLPTQ